MSKRRFPITASSIRPLFREFIREPLPLALGTFTLAIALSLQAYGYIPGCGRVFPVAGIHVAVWLLVFVGLWTGYVMGLVGQANGILFLPYAISALGFTGINVSSTALLITLINPLGALVGYRRGRQWNPDLARWLCIGAALGAPLGPFARYHLLGDPAPFKAAVGLILIVVSLQLMVQAFVSSRPGAVSPRESAGNFHVRTLETSFKSLTITYNGRCKTLHVPTMFFTGFVIGGVSATLGIGGGFLLVPLLSTFFGLPMYILVAASIPFVVVLSCTGLLSYIFLLPSLSKATASPDWVFGLMTASGAVLGAWLAAKTQRYFPERVLKTLLGSITGIAGLLYVLVYLLPA